MMVLIVAHHYVVNSGLLWMEGAISTYPGSFRSIFLLVFGAWGKTGINCFVLISGYFMCKSSISLKKFLRLYLEVIFYAFIIYLIFCINGYEIFTLKGLCATLWPIDSVSTGFTSCYLLFYLLIPFLNILIQNLNEKMHVSLILISVFIYSVLGTVSEITVVMNYVTWFVVLYLIAAYLRCYPKSVFQNTKIWGWATVFCILFSTMSIVYRSWSGIGDVYYHVADSNKILAVATALCSFMFFKSLNIKYNKVINTIGGSTFGVLQIHANSDAMRTWLWRDTLKNVELFHSRWMPLHAIGSVLIIFAVCTLLDTVRKYLLEKPFFILWDRYYDRILEFCKEQVFRIVRR